ncbi:cobalamin-binding protein [Salirhabdus salicampi]|uniref:cobalamin-binding protein n=1 Tax=Salirhabdus salicampi TaxID=476102 RepID=UPI0020C22701|nr:cobalamin-binding protein [Salirhabdus salicampi]MCP8615475.1 cobalamin-binding protein [Salirhabdus salicampi]
MRIVSICPSNTEIVHYLGLTDKLVAVDDYSDWPEQVQHLPKVGPDLNIDIEKVEQLKPDLVMASLSVPGMEKNVQALKERGIPYIVLNPNSLQEIGDDIITVGKYTGTEPRARAVAKKYFAFLHKYKQYAEGIQRPKSLYWEWWPKPVFTPGGRNWLTEVSILAGGKNVFADVNQASVQTTWQDVYNRKPDYICMIWVGVQTDKMNPELMKKREGWNSLHAINKGNILVLDEDLYCRPSPRLLQGISKISALLHPNIFPVYTGKDPLL